MTPDEAFVLDGSVMTAACFPDEQPEYALMVVAALKTHKAIVPAIWPAEVANALMSGYRRKRCPYAHVVESLSMIARLPVSVDPAFFSETMPMAAGIAKAFELSVYDASYVELALRYQLPLATLDNAMQRAADEFGVRCFVPGAWQA